MQGDGEFVNMAELLVDALPLHDGPLHATPPCLAVHLPQTLWCPSFGDEVLVDLHESYLALWPPGARVSFSVGEQSVSYRLKAFIERRGSHFVTHFREGSDDLWYTADDSLVGVLHEQPDAFRMLRFLEKESTGGTFVPWQPRPVRHSEEDEPFCLLQR